MPQPIKKFHVGAVQAAVWENTSKEGNAFSTVSLARSYKDAKGDWQHTNSLNANDLPKAILALQKAYEYIALKEPEEGSGMPTVSQIE